MNAPDTGIAFRNDAPTTRGLRGGGVLPPELLAPFTVLDDRRAALAVATTVLPIIALLALGAAVWTPWVVLLTLPFTAALQQALFVLAHEAAHYRLFSDRRLNEGVGRLLGAVVGISMCTYRVVHRLHHNHLYGALDPDIAMNGGYPRGRRYLLRKLATDISGRTAWKTYGYFFGNPATNVATIGAVWRTFGIVPVVAFSRAISTRTGSRRCLSAMAPMRGGSVAEKSAVCFSAGVAACNMLDCASSRAAIFSSSFVRMARMFPS